MRTVLAGTESWHWVTKSQGCDALELWVGEVKGVVFRGCAVYGPIAGATSGKETCLLVFREVVPDGS